MANIPAKTGVKGGGGFGNAMSAFPLEADISPCLGDVGLAPIVLQKSFRLQNAKH